VEYRIVLSDFRYNAYTRHHASIDAAATARPDKKAAEGDRREQRQFGGRERITDIVYRRGTDSVYAIVG
jgi:hypothetical protein